MVQLSPVWQKLSCPLHAISNLIVLTINTFASTTLFGSQNICSAHSKIQYIIHTTLLLDLHWLWGALIMVCCLRYLCAIGQSNKLSFVIWVFFGDWTLGTILTVPANCWKVSHIFGQRNTNATSFRCARLRDSPTALSICAAQHLLVQVTCGEKAKIRYGQKTWLRSIYLSSLNTISNDWKPLKCSVIIVLKNWHCLSQVFSILRTIR